MFRVRRFAALLAVSAWAVPSAGEARARGPAPGVGKALAGQARAAAPAADDAQKQLDDEVPYSIACEIEELMPGTSVLRNGWF